MEFKQGQRIIVTDNGFTGAPLRVGDMGIIMVSPCTPAGVYTRWAQVKMDAMREYGATLNGEGWYIPPHCMKIICFGTNKLSAFFCGCVECSK